MGPQASGVDSIKVIPCDLELRANRVDLSDIKGCISAFTWIVSIFKVRPDSMNCEAIDKGRNMGRGRRAQPARRVNHKIPCFVAIQTFAITAAGGGLNST